MKDTEQPTPVLGKVEKNTWLDISMETEREYIYRDHVVRIEKPTLLHVSASSLGGHAHRVQTAEGLGYYVAPGWSAIRWRVAYGQPLFKI